MASHMASAHEVGTSPRTWLMNILTHVHAYKRRGLCPHLRCVLESVRAWNAHPNAHAPERTRTCARMHLLTRASTQRAIQIFYANACNLQRKRQRLPWRSLRTTKRGDLGLGPTHKQLAHASAHDTQQEHAHPTAHGRCTWVHRT